MEEPPEPKPAFNRKQSRSLVEICCIIITSTVCAVLLLAVAVPLFTGREYSQDRIELIAGAFDKLVAVILLVIGAAVQKLRDKS